MREELSTIQQTLTPEAASVLNHSIAEAGRRNHGQTTPLHVAATLLASPSGFLRQACIKSHTNSLHPLHCRALELCFSVALERLPTPQNMSLGMEPPLSNALMAALKRAQAHQRRGCPEQQQQPLLAVKVELEQLIISTLDDPSVSRVMREARFSSPAVKDIIEQSLNSSSSATASALPSLIGFGLQPAVAPTSPSQNLYMNLRLQQPQGSQNGGQSEVKRVVDILLRDRKRNPVFVGDSEPDVVMKEVVRRIEKRELDEGLLHNVEVVHLVNEFSSDRMQILGKVKELGGFIEARMAKSNSGGIILNLGDLKWLVEQPVSSNGDLGSGSLQPQQIVSEEVRDVVAEIGRLLARFRDGGSGQLWLIGTATCETYLRCQVHHPSMENDWDLQTMSIAARAPLPGLFPRLSTNGIYSTSMEALSPLKSFLGALRHPSESTDPTLKARSCPQCKQNFEQDLEKVIAKESEKSDSNVKSEEALTPLPQWLQTANVLGEAKTLDQTKDQELNIKQKTEQLQKKWSDMCFRLHPSFHQQTLSSERMASSRLSMMALSNSNLLRRPPAQSNLQANKKLGESLQLSSNRLHSQPSGQIVSPSGSPVRTELTLGQTKFSPTSTEQAHVERIKDFIGCIPSEPQNNFSKRLIDVKQPFQLNVDSFKKLFKGLIEKVWWQREAATAVAATASQCKLGKGKKRGTVSKGDMWLLFVGPDRVGKKKMASALSELVSESSPVMVNLGSRHCNGETDVGFRGKTVVDRIAEVVRRNPFSVIMLEDINEADLLVRGSIKCAMERGRIADSHGREISLGSVMFILTADWLPDDFKYLANGSSHDEQKLERIARGGWQLKLSLSERTAKRRPNWLHDDHRPSRPKKDTYSALEFDLNEAADTENYRSDGLHNSSDHTIECEKEHILDNDPSPTYSSVLCDLLDTVDEVIVFKPVNINMVQSVITSSITKKISSIFGDGISLEVQDDAAEKILSRTWFGQMSLEEWAEEVLVSSLQQIKSCLAGAMLKDSMVIRLEQDSNSDVQSCGELLPSSIKVVVAMPNGF